MYRTNIVLLGLWGPYRLGSWRPSFVLLLQTSVHSGKNYYINKSTFPPMEFCGISNRVCFNFATQLNNIYATVSKSSENREDI